MAKTVRDLIRATGLSEPVVYAGIRIGELPGYYVGKRVTIPDEAFEDFIHGRWQPRPRQLFIQPRVTVKPTDLIQKRETA